MKMMEVNTVNLIGPALDWLIATIEQLPIRHDPMAFGNTLNGGFWVWDESPGGAKLMIKPPKEDSRSKADYYSPSTSWSQLGPLRDKWRVHISPIIYDQQPWDRAWIETPDRATACGPTATVAVCRAIAVYHYGSRVQVPEELAQLMTTKGGNVL